ncbi:hypothetical protein TCAL_07102 [Tigriopus californicus]|uniref:Kinetochore protein NDC80 n=2 Tax=Tigriopus californicus TaxID=6832 RepID=A0A553PCP4_TIGCA|nr:kinetochore protein NDC80 homolog isoform X2 [Tigriopus californicus]XP_059078585.1 kinetochore protein NDC80 homolog isoform X2 [Tigriopus californicus]TRY75452.1 hypothetical protein TCAL_07102 [Tigriopus californicus]
MAPGGGNVARRSLGTKPNLCVPKRISTEKARQGPAALASSRPSASVPGAAPAPSSSTRIPRPSMKGGASRASAGTFGMPKRSTSASHRPASSSAFKTPRSASALSRTPSSVLKPSNLANTMNRYSMSSNRGSHIGTKMVKDARNLNDKAWQSRTIQDIIGFVQEYGYPKELSPSDFPLSTTEFKGVFEFLVNFLIPGYEIGQQRLELVLPGFLKKIGYPTQVSKSCFQTLGTKHSWPSVLGILDYLLRRAQSLVIKEKHISTICFPNKDENGFALPGESDDRLMFDFFVQVYDEFNRGQENFEPQLEKLRLRLMENHEVDPDSIRQLERDRRACREELIHLEEVPNRCEALLKRNTSTKADLKSMNQYLDELKRYNEKKSKDLEEMTAKRETLVKKKAILEKEIEENTAACLAKGIDPEACNLDFVTQSLRNQIQAQRELLKMQDNNCGSVEIKLGKKIQETDTLIREYNKKLLGIDVEETHDLRLDRFRDPQELVVPLQNLMKAMRTEERNIELEMEKINMNVSKLRLAIKSKEDELEVKKNEFEEIKTQRSKLEATIQDEDAVLTKSIQDLKAKLIKIKETQMEGQTSLEDLQKEVDLAEKSVSSLKREYEAKKVENMAFIDGAFKKFREFMDTKEKQKKEVAEAIQEKAKLKIERMDKVLEVQNGALANIESIMKEVLASQKS